MKRAIAAAILALAVPAVLPFTPGAVLAQVKPAEAPQPVEALKPGDPAPATASPKPGGAPLPLGTAPTLNTIKPDTITPIETDKLNGIDLGNTPAPPVDATMQPGNATPLSSGPVDLAYGAFQRGFYFKAFEEATKRVSSSQDPVAMTLIGQLYANGLGVPRDKLKAAQWYSEAAERGDRNAIYSYGMAKLTADGVPKDEAGGMLLLNRAAELLVPEASYNLGIIALKPTNGSPDYATAYKRFSEAAIANNGDALYSLGVLTKDGKGTPLDAKKAAQFFLAAANAGNLDGMVEYGLALFNGDGVQADQELAGDWLERAAERGSPIARNRLARMYAAGVGLAPNPILACMWNILAKAAGLQDKQLDEFMAQQAPEVQAAAIQGARYHGLR